jgi:hypothetical protein
MPRWGFFEWLVYGCFAVGATVMAIDQAIKLSSLRELGWAKTITEGNIWAFTPFAMLFISGGIILFRTISSSVTRPSISTPAIEKTDEIGFELPKSLNTLTNHELRLTAYNIAAHVEYLCDNYIQQDIEINNQNLSADEKASRRAMRDQRFNREFREMYAHHIITIQTEIVSRIKDNKEPLIEFPNGLLGWREISPSGYRLISLSDHLA